MITPTRNPIVSDKTASTMTTASMRFTMKARIDSATTFDCQEIFSTPIPTGKSATNSARRASIARPTSTTLAPEAAAKAKAIAGWPFCRSRFVGGSMYPVVTVVKSLMRVISSRLPPALPAWAAPAIARSAIASGDVEFASRGYAKPIGLVVHPAGVHDHVLRL